VQRDILPIVEGTTVNTRHGFVRTDHILFIAAGAFHVSKPATFCPGAKVKSSTSGLSSTRWKLRPCSSNHALGFDT